MNDSESEGIVTDCESDGDYDFEYETKNKFPEKFKTYLSQHPPDWDAKGAKWAKKDDLLENVTKIMQDKTKQIWKERNKKRKYSLDIHVLICHNYEIKGSKNAMKCGKPKRKKADPEPKPKM